MNKLLGDENTSPINIKTRLLELPEEIQNIELSIRNMISSLIRNEEVLDNIEEEVSKKLNEDNSNSYTFMEDKDFEIAVKEKLEHTSEYRYTAEKVSKLRSRIELNEIKLRYLNNTFKAYLSIYRDDKK